MTTTFCIYNRYDINKYLVGTLEKKKLFLNCRYYTEYPRCQLTARQVNGRLVLEGVLRIYWGTDHSIRLKQYEDNRVINRLVSLWLLLFLIQKLFFWIVYKCFITSTFICLNWRYSYWKWTTNNFFDSSMFWCLFKVRRPLQG